MSHAVYRATHTPLLQQAKFFSSVYLAVGSLIAVPALLYVDAPSIAPILAESSALLPITVIHLLTRRYVTRIAVEDEGATSPSSSRQRSIKRALASNNKFDASSSSVMLEIERLNVMGRKYAVHTTLDRVRLRRGVETTGDGEIRKKRWMWNWEMEQPAGVEGLFVETRVLRHDPLGSLLHDRLTSRMEAADNAQDKT